MSDGFIGGWTVKRGDGAGSEVFTAVEECRSIGELGKTKSLEEVTSFSSPAGVKEFIPGLAEGSEISLECILDLDGAQQLALRGDIDNDVTQRNMQVEVTDGTSTVTMDFTVAPLSYVYGPNVEGANTITFTMKISGEITYS